MPYNRQRLLLSDRRAMQRVREEGAGDRSTQRDHWRGAGRRPTGASCNRYAIGTRASPHRPRPKKKAPIHGTFSIAGAGFEPATFGL
jgi:hypothetical protein